MEAVNDTSTVITYNPPEVMNSPNVSYRIHRAPTSFSVPLRHKVERGTRFFGNGYYKFPPETIPQGVTFTGKILNIKSKLDK